jgi:pimeloyl-ACP methyl ester carboxylesterase
LDWHQGFDIHLNWVDELLDRTGLEHAALCGISFGGLVAVHYAAHRPSRTRAVVLVSTPSPSWKPNCQIERYLRSPRLMSPVFALSSPLRLYPEIARAFPNLLSRGAFTAKHLYRVTRHPFAPTAMAQRVRLMKDTDFADDCRRMAAPTLIVTGTPGLDRVVPVENTREYLSAIPGSHGAEIADTGHMGLVTKPKRFADTVCDFVCADAAARVQSQVPA